MFSIREAKEEDAKQLSELAERTFIETFGAVNSKENMQLHCEQTYSEAKQAAEITNPKMRTLLAEQDDKLVGFVQLRFDHAPECVTANKPGELQRLYIDSSWHGKGIAQKLLNASLDVLRERGCDVMWLGVWEDNPRAIRFYEKNKFREVGSHVFPLGTDPQRDILMQRAVN